MKKTLLLSFVALSATLFASGNTFKMSLTQDSTVEGKTLKAGDYKVSFENGNAVIKQGRETIEVAAHEENDQSKFPVTELVYHEGENLSEVHFGGTHTKIVFDGGNSMNATQGQ